MKICVKDAFVSQAYSKKYSLDIDEDEILPLPAYTSGVHAEITVTAKDGRVFCETEIKARFETLCSRCAKPISLEFVSADKKQIRRDDDCDSDVITVDGGMFFDAYEEIRSQIYFNFPAKPLCRENCKGLCPVCGCDLNDKSCSCDTRTVDPRLAVLRKLIDNN